MRGGNHPFLPLTLTAYPTPIPGQGSKKNCIKMTVKDDPTISCSHFMAELSVSAGRKNKTLWGGSPPSVDEGYGDNYMSPKPKIGMFCMLSQNYQHCKKTMHAS